jgi:hypothetical protein
MTGICFGHQIIAEALGGKTERSTKGWGIGLRESHVVDPEFESILDKYTIISIVPVLPSTIIKCFLLLRVLLVYLQFIVSSHAIDMLHDCGKLMFVGYPCLFLQKEIDLYW